ncbi:MAG: hypothetical protein Ct9H300mP8_03910 [Gammaproteobacteria bacterium]|nr:MAG: hypothetical protein Ct9H300mP8_03910 [Gammaproteobacteria bacterium]
MLTVALRGKDNGGSVSVIQWGPQSDAGAADGQIGFKRLLVDPVIMPPEAYANWERDRPFF